MKKLLPLLGLSLIFLLCLSLKSPPLIFAQADDDPDLNLDIRSYEPITGNLDYIYFEHDIDPKAPQLNTLIEKVPLPEISSLYQVYDWDWTTNTRSDNFTPKPGKDTPGDFASLVGFSTTTGDAILVPTSDYDIGGGYEVVVIYADPDSITFNYMPDSYVGNPGYTIHLENFQVDQDLLNHYNELNEAGRDELPALMAGMKIGKAIGDEILVAIRDTGSFMDPRWLRDWWQDIPAESLKLILESSAVQEAGIAPPSLTCTPSYSGDRTSRPAPCDPCNLTYSYCPSCATSFTVNDTVTFSCCEGPCVETPWGGTVEINASETTIPFVGYKGKEGDDKSEYEKNYLADYFEGTNEYYDNYSMYWKEWIDHAGVLRKLTPMEYQNQLKKKMVERALTTTGPQKEGVHDYNLEYVGRLCWDFPFLIDAALAIAQRSHIPISIVNTLLNATSQRAHYCVFDEAAIFAARTAIAAFNAISPIDIIIKIDTTDEDATLTALDGHFPPEPDEEDYVEKWNAWKKSEWSNLWQVTPMVSRDDTPGYILPYYGWRPKDEPKPGDVPFDIEKVPHVARLYEATQEVNNMLLPYQESEYIGQKKAEPIIASAKEQVLGEKTLLAQIDPIRTPRGCKFLYGNPDCNCVGQGNCLGRHTLTPLPNKMGPLCGWEDCSGGEPDFSATPTAPAEPAVCGLAAPMPVAGCDQPAITDSNDNDKICGEPYDCEKYEPIKIDLEAVDAFKNTPCSRREICNPNTGICRDPCARMITKDVNRKFGIYLLHPYLTDIWNQTGKANTAGLFNIFRPAEIPKFEEVDAADEIKYSYTDTSIPVAGGYATPETGKFYFNYLGGVQLAKEWLIRALTPQVDSSL